jgi:hypothetical protein
MLRLAYAVLAAPLAVMVLRPSPTTDPPSSLEPTEKPASITFSYRASRIKACVLDLTGSKRRCSGKSEAVQDKAAILLTPVPIRRLDGRDPRKPVSIIVARENHNLKLGTGEWELQWAGYGRIEPFRVDPGVDFTIKLSKVRGKCKPEMRRCALDGASVTRRVEMPSGQRR